MSASVALHPAAKARDRSIEARRAARRVKFERERLIVNSLNRGVPVAEIAGRIGVTEKRMRALVKDSLARRMPAAPEEFAALQVSRLNEALLVAYSAMAPENLRAVGMVVRIVRELDRYHGFAAPGRRAPRPRDAEAQEPLALADNFLQQAGTEPEKLSRRSPDAASERVQTFALSPADVPAAPGAPPADQPELPSLPPDLVPSLSKDVPGPTNAAAAPWIILRQAQDEVVALAPPPVASLVGSDRPESAPQALEKMESAPKNGVVPRAARHHSDGKSKDPFVGAKMAPQAIESLKSAPGSGAIPTGGTPPYEGGCATGVDAPGQAPATSPDELPFQAIESLYPVAPVLVPDPAAPGGFRRVNIRMLPNGMAVC